MGRTWQSDAGFTARLRTFVDSLGTSDRKVALGMGITPAAISSALGGRSYLAPENLRKLHDLYGLNINWLLSGEGEMLLAGRAGANTSGAPRLRSVREPSPVDPVGPRPTPTVDLAILAACISAVKDGLSAHKRTIPSAKEAEIVAALYDVCVTAGTKRPAGALLRLLVS